jgi:hypothetical protein
MSPEEQREANEKERKARQSGQDKAAEQLRKENEAAAIAAVSKHESTHFCVFCV